MNATATHTVKVITVCNGGAKAMRAVCSCGHLGVRFAYLPKTVQVAKAKAHAEAASAEWATHSA
jgi:hypothetical protein